MLQNYCRWDGEDARRCSVRGNARHKHAQHNTAVLLPLQLHIDGPNVTIKQAIWDNDTCGQSISAGPLFYTVACSTFTQGWHRFLEDVHAKPTRGTKSNQQRAVWTRGWNPGSTHIHKTNTGCWSEWKQKHACSQEGPERHVVVITLPANSVMPLLPFFRLCSITSSICYFNSPSQHRPGSFPSIFSSLFLCLLCLHVSHEAARLARELQDLCN